MHGQLHVCSDTVSAGSQPSVEKTPSSFRDVSREVWAGTSVLTQKSNYPVQTATYGMSRFVPSLPS